MFKCIDITNREMVHKNLCCLKQFSYICGVIQCKNKQYERYNSYKWQTIYISSKKGPNVSQISKQWCHYLSFSLYCFLSLGFRISIGQWTHLSTVTDLDSHLLKNVNTLAKHHGRFILDGSYTDVAEQMTEKVINYGHRVDKSWM